MRAHRLPFRGALVCFALAVFGTVHAESDSIDNYIEAEMEARHLPGLSLAIVKDGELVKARGYGLADVEGKVPATPNTVYQLASATKSFSATAIMLLVEDGKIGLDDRISKYVDGLPRSWSEITVRQLLSHTSGIPNYLRSPNVKWDQNYTPEQIVQLVTSSPVSFPACAKWEYCNTGYVLLAMIIKRVSGQDYDLFLKERVFVPLGMTSTGLSKPSERGAEIAKGYQWEGGKRIDAERLNSSLWDNGDGGLVSSVLDLAKFDQALGSGRLLRESSRRAMWSDAKLSNSYEARTMFDDQYGFGWFLDYYRGHRLVWHSGGRPGAVSVISRLVDDQLTVILLANLDGWNPEGMSRGVAGLYSSSLMLPSMMAAEPDGDAKMTSRLRDVFWDVAQGKKDSSLMTDGEMAAIPDGGDAEFAELQKGMTLMEFIGEDDVRNRQSELSGLPIVRIRYYKGTTRERPMYLTFFLTADGKTALVQSWKE
jgi:D-alanyl-D-alanine carboxypeptidase